MSTHSPRVGRTVILNIYSVFDNNFNSLAPRGANLEIRLLVSSSLYFNSLAPRGANQRVKFALDPPGTISTHSPRVGRTMHAL